MLSQSTIKTWDGGLNDCLSYCYERLQGGEAKSLTFICGGTTVQASVSEDDEIDFQIKPNKTNE